MSIEARKLIAEARDIRDADGRPYVKEIATQLAYALETALADVERLQQAADADTLRAKARRHYGWPKQ